MRTALVVVFCLMLAAPAYAQKSEERQAKERQATIFFGIGAGVAATGIMSLIAGNTSVGLPMVGAGGGLMYYGIHLNNQAKRMPSTTFGAVPLKKGVAFAVVRTW